MILVFVNNGFLALPMAIFQIIIGLIPFVCGILAYVFLGETMDRYTIFTMIVCFGAIVLLAFANRSQTDSEEKNLNSA